MRPPFNDHAARVCAAIGALGATCAMTLGVQNAQATTTQAPTNARATLTGRRPVDVTPARSADPAVLAANVVHSVEWMPSALDPARRRAIRHRRHVDPTTATIRRMVQAGDRIATLPYTWGGGHGSFDSAGYDCSGSVSYLLHGGGLLSTPMDSSGLEGYGLPGPGRHVTIYANAQHALMVIDGRRFDTIALQETGTRWSSSIGSLDGYTVRHPAGL